MAIQRGSSLEGLPAPKLLPLQPINAVDMQTVARDQGYAKEKLTNTNAVDGTSAPVVEGHKHSEPGNLRYLPWFTQLWGLGGTYVDLRTGAFPVGVQTGPYAITPTSSTVAQYNVTAFYVLVYVLHGWENRPLRFAIDHEGATLLSATVYDSTLTAVTGLTNRALRSIGNSGQAADPVMASMSVLDFSVSTAGLYVLDFKTSLLSTQQPRKFHGAWLWPLPPVFRGTVGEQWEAAAVGANVQIGDPENSNRWHPVDGNVVAEDAPYGAGPLILAHNANLLFEQATGAPTRGNESLTATPHRHAGSGDHGADIDHNVCSWSFGGRWSQGLTEINGTRAKAFYTAGTTARTCIKARIWTPASAHLTGGAVSPTSRLRAYFLVENSDSKGDTIEVTLIISGTTYTFTSSGVDGVKLLTTATGGITYLTYASGANTIEVKLRKSVSGSSDDSFLYAMALVLEQ